MQDTFLYNSRGKHIAVFSDGFLYTPFGYYLGRWDDAAKAFIDRNGWYLGHVVEGDRLARESDWLFAEKNFGDRGNEGDRTGWKIQYDIDPCVLPTGYEDVKLIISKWSDEERKKVTRSDWLDYDNR